MMLLKITLFCVFGVLQCVYAVHSDVDMFERAVLGRRGSLNFYKEYLFGFKTLIFETLQILSMHKQLGTLQRQRKT